MIKTITIIGSGNVASHMGKELKNSGLQVVEVFSPNRQHANNLAGLLNAGVSDNLSTLSPKSDLYLICVPDKFVKTVSDEIPFTTGIVAHTSGITPLSAVKRHINHGVFYPLQTFSKNSTIDFMSVPFCLEASSKDVLNQLYETASLLSCNVKNINSKNRMLLHLAAVFVNNFVNYLYSVSYELLNENNLSFDFLIPLIEETANKIKNTSPLQAQTGPAMRNDKHTIALHSKLLLEQPEIKHLYNEISNLIYQKYYE